MESRDHHEKLETERPNQDRIDFDVRPAGPYADQRPDYQPRKRGGGLGRIWVGIVVVAIILGATWYAFKSEPAAETFSEAQPAATQPEDLTPRTPEGAQSEQESGMATFAPAQEDDPEGAASTETATASGGSSESAAGPSAAQNGGTPAASGAETGGSGLAAAPAKPAAKPTESQSSVALPPVAESPASTAPTAGDQSAAAPAKPAAKPAEGQSAPAASGQAAASRAASVPAAEISDLWVVNISSTPDEEESKRLLKRIDGQDLGGQMYFYQTMVNGRLQHRIRVGFFTTKTEAETVGEKIKTDFNLVATPWAVQPTVDEVEKYKKD